MILRSVQMRLYALHKRQFVAVFVLFLVCLLITILIGIAGPSVIQSIDYTSETPPKQLVRSLRFDSTIFSLPNLVRSVSIEIGISRHVPSASLVDDAIGDREQR